MDRRRTLRAAIAIADTERLDAVSMRRFAAEFGVGPMSLYRHVASKEELVTQMTDEVFGEPELPVPGPDGWRAKLELISRLQWEPCRRHLWLPRAVSLVRPSLAPNVMEHTEWTLRALDGLGLPMTTRIREALTLPALVLSVALSMADESRRSRRPGGAGAPVVPSSDQAAPSRAMADRVPRDRTLETRMASRGRSVGRPYSAAYT
ncbi:TetR/AcrR family transcriptional regulator [Streptosporangium sp. LJ11]|uniref:TetR/AcrR family transcriptional regulator n=1 Tax=Streptosporangium sp. LJ11 TaxID=3436927 RepID=UPI003F7AF8C5